jgi:hypothetical protein
MIARRFLVTALVATLLGLVVAAPLAAQELPQTQTAQFSNWGPNQQPPQPYTAVPTDRAFIAPVGQAIAPAPQLWSGCNFFLGGTWSISGTQDVPAGFNYTANLTVTQFGQWLQGHLPMAGVAMQYFGRCTGNTVQFDLYANNQFIGHQVGTVNWSPRWNTFNASFRWNVWNPEFATGSEDWLDRWFTQ